MFVAVHLLLLFVSDFAFFYFIFLLKKTESLTRLKEKKKPDRLGRPVFYRFCAGSHVFFRFAGTPVLRTGRTGNRSGFRFDWPVRF
jgi:hypothetical protein